MRDYSEQTDGPELEGQGNVFGNLLQIKKGRKKKDVNPFCLMCITARILAVIMSRLPLRRS